MERADLEQWKAREVARLLALVETERRYYQEIVASIPVGLLVLSADLSIISANRAIKKIFGLRSGDSVRGRLDTLLPGWVLDRVLGVLQSGAPETGVIVETEHEIKRVLRVGILPIRNWDDEAEQEALLSIEDITGLQTAAPAPEAAAEEASAPAEPQPEAVVIEPVEEEPAPEPVVEEPVPAAEAAPAEEAAAAPEPEPEAFPASKLIDELDAIVWAVELPSMRFLFVSSHAESMLGFPSDQWSGNESFWSERVFASDREWVTQSYQRAIERGEGHASEFRAVTAGGRIVWLRERASILKDAEGNPKYLIGVAVDVTERRLLEDQLVQSERIEAMTRLASRMAHDLNNMLMILTGYGEELLSAIPAGSSLRGDVQEILAATERMSALTNQLLAFARRQSVPVTPIPLEALLVPLADRMRVLTGDRIELQLKLAEHSSRVHADGSQLEQVIVAIVERARQAMPGEGRIVVETSDIHITEDLRRADAPLRPGSYAVITIGYTGRPLEGEARVALFETVLGTKETWDEAAAAATRAYGIVRQWGGDISVSSSPVEGSLFRIYLQRVEEYVVPPSEPERVEPQAVEPEAPAPEPERKAETILVVEDEAGIRALVRKILHRQGYEVLEAASGDEALALSSEYSGSIDLLITDVMMPQMGGRELADRLREQRRDIRVLYVSGYTDDTAIYATSFPPGTAFLQKPFTLGSLLDKVKEVLSVTAGF